MRGIFKLAEEQVASHEELSLIEFFSSFHKLCIKAVDFLTRVSVPAG